jgi:hypothetical protein
MTINGIIIGFLLRNIYFSFVTYDNDATRNAKVLDMVVDEIGKMNVMAKEGIYHDSQVSVTGN